MPKPTPSARWTDWQPAIRSGAAQLRTRHSPGPRLCGRPRQQRRGLAGLGRFAEALLCYDRVIAASPDYAHAHCNRGIVFQELMRMEEAVISLNRAIALRPDFAYAQWNKAINLLLQGHYPEGWALYEWGWQINQRGPVRNFAQPLWKGAESLAGKTILLHAEQGIGDAISSAATPGW